MNAQFIDLEALTRQFSVFFVDQFGVLHDGEKPYPGAVDALAEIRRSGAKVVVLSNSGKRSSANIARFEALGFTSASYDLFLTSGEVAFALLRSRLIRGELPNGAKCFMIARDTDLSAVDGLNLTLVDDGAEAQVILIAGSKGDSLTLEHYEDLLRVSAARNIPCICTNPDKVMLTNMGLRFGAGAIAERYEAIGGSVEWVGKPYPAIYRAALEAMGHPLLSSVICIGDSIEHDIVGGAKAELATALVRTGILADASEQVLQDQYALHGVTPDFSLTAFRFEYEDKGR